MEGKVTNTCRKCEHYLYDAVADQYHPEFCLCEDSEYFYALCLPDEGTCKYWEPSEQWKDKAK